MGGGFCNIHTATHESLEGPGALLDIRREQFIPIERDGKPDTLRFESDQLASGAMVPCR